MIRRFRKDDMARVTEIANQAWREIYNMYQATQGDELFNLRVPDRDHIKGKQLEEHYENHPDWLFVYEENEYILGFITFTLDFKTKIGEIGNNAVDKTIPRKGIGQQMYAAVFDYFRINGILYAKVSTGLDYAHEPARKAYERAGFDIRNENVVYYKKL